MIELNEKQKQAAEFMFGKASVIAIPGSGKTLTMAARIGNLVQEGIPPERILGLTFTRNAAGAMREKLRPVLQIAPFQKEDHGRSDRYDDGLAAFRV
jgi:DNA helicase-2/ATP-dependent DNA helicase PcrA